MVLFDKENINEFCYPVTNLLHKLKFKSVYPPNILLNSDFIMEIVFPWFSHFA